MDHDGATVVVSSSSETMDVLAGVLRFGKSLRHRKGVVIAYLLIASVLGGAYFVTADRVYQSEGELMVLPTGADVMDSKSGKPLMIDRDMPNYEKMVRSDTVIRSTLQALPREHYRDFIGVEPSEWESAFRQRLSVSTARGTNIMTVSYRSSDPVTAYEVLRTLFGSYVKYVNGIYEQDSNKVLDILRNDLKGIEQEIRETERAYIELLSASPLLVGSENEQTNVYAERVKSLNMDWLEANKRLREAEVFLAKLEQAIANGEDLQQFFMEMVANGGSELLKNQMGISSTDGYAISRLREDLREARTKLQNLRAEGYLANHPRVKDLENSIANMEHELQNHRNVVKSAADAIAQTELGPRLLHMARQRRDLAAESEREIRRAYEAASQQAKQLNSQLVKVRQMKEQFEALKRKRDEYMSTMSKILLDQQHGLFTQINVDPQIVRTPVAPRLPLVAMVTLFLGFTAACATVYVLNLLDDRFHTPDELRSQVGAPILAMVRRLTPLADGGLSALYTYSRPNAPESEAFRTLRTALDFSGGGARRLTISSTEPSDGKTTIISNLAVAFAQSGKRTLLIDGDMRRPGLTRLFNQGGHPGLSTVLRDTRAIEEAVQGTIIETELEKLHLMPAGLRPVNPVELLTSDRLAELIAWAETHYDQLLIDAPPSLAVTDAAIIGRSVDGAILTVRPDKNRRTLVLRASEALTSLGCELLGLVINSVQPRTDHEYSYAYGYGHTGYGDVDTEADSQHTENSRPDARRSAQTGSTIGIARERSDRRSIRKRAA